MVRANESYATDQQVLDRAWKDTIGVGLAHCHLFHDHTDKRPIKKTYGIGRVFSQCLDN